MTRADVMFAKLYESALPRVLGVFLFLKCVQRKDGSLTFVADRLTLQMNVAGKTGVMIKLVLKKSTRKYRGCHSKLETSLKKKNGPSLKTNNT